MARIGVRGRGTTLILGVDPGRDLADDEYFFLSREIEVALTSRAVPKVIVLDGVHIEGVLTHPARVSRGHRPRWAR